MPLNEHTIDVHPDLGDVEVMAAHLARRNPHWSKVRVRDRAYIEASKAMCPPDWEHHLTQEEVVIARAKAFAEMGHANAEADAVYPRLQPPPPVTVRRHYLDRA